MTVANEVNRSGPYTGNGVTTIFAYGFRILAEAHIQVIRAEDDVETVLVLDTDYTVADVGDAGGGSITLIVAPTADQTLTILRNAPFTQETDLENQGPFFAETIEASLDLAAMRDQQLQEQIDRSVKIPPSADADAMDSLLEDIVRLGGMADAIDAVADNAANINAVASNIGDISAVAADLTELFEARDTIVEISDQIEAGYLGDKTSFPATDNDGEPLLVGARFFLTEQVDPDDDGEYRWDGDTWSPTGVLPTAIERKVSVFATDGQTSVPVSGGYSAGRIDVFRNGVFQKIGDTAGTGITDADCVASDGLTVVFPSGVLTEDDWLQFVMRRSFSTVVLDVEAADIPFTPAGGVAAENVQDAIAELDTEKAAKAVTLSGGGLVSGGGDLSANRTLTVTKASAAEVVTGTDDTKAVTPLGVAAALAAAAASPALILVSSGTVAVAAAVLDVALPAGYRQFEIIIDQIEPATADQGLISVLSFDSGVTFKTTAGDYRLGGRYEGDGGVGGAWNSASATAMLLGRAQVVSAGQNALLRLTVNMPSSSRRTWVQWSFGHVFTGSIVTHLVGSGRCMAANTAATHIRFAYQTGNIAAGARWQLYGWKN